MKKWFKKLDISTGLQLSFIICAVFCLLLGIIGLYSWQQQNNGMKIAMEENFPKVQSAFQAEKQINLVENSFDSLIQITNYNEQIKWQNYIQSNLQKLHSILAQLNETLDDQTEDNLNQLELIITSLIENITKQYLLNEEFNKLSIKIDWLHNDFHNEYLALLQDISWQESSLLSETSLFNNKHHSLKTLQNDSLIIYDFISCEEKIIIELINQINNKTDYNPNIVKNTLIYLENLIQQKSLQLTEQTETQTIKQIIAELLNIGLNPEILPNLLERRLILSQEQKQLIQHSEKILNNIRWWVTQQVGNNEQKLTLLQEIIQKSSQLSGFIILATMLVVFLFIVAVNFFYIRLRLLKRFHLLNHSVSKLINGEKEIEIPVYGTDELARIATLLRLFLSEMNQQHAELIKRNQLLSKEINERIAIQNTLESTQNELIQTAKLAVVGKTLTSIHHEITQPLNAINAYLFSAKKMLKQQQFSETEKYLDKITLLIERVNLIIKRLRHFSKQGNNQLKPIKLENCIKNAWEILEPKIRNHHAVLEYPDKFPSVLGEEIIIEQVFVNLFLNAIEALENTHLHIKIQQYYENKKLYVWVSDNGKGWPLTERLLQPFNSNKSINLGLGLSISQSIMHQCHGELYLASTLEKNALIILTFEVIDNVGSI